MLLLEMQIRITTLIVAEVYRKVFLDKEKTAISIMK